MSLLGNGDPSQARASASGAIDTEDQEPVEFRAPPDIEFRNTVTFDIVGSGLGAVAHEACRKRPRAAASSLNALDRLMGADTGDFGGDSEHVPFSELDATVVRPTETGYCYLCNVETRYPTVSDWPEDATELHRIMMVSGTPLRHRVGMGMLKYTSVLQSVVDEKTRESMAWSVQSMTEHASGQHTGDMELQLMQTISSICYFESVMAADVCVERTVCAADDGDGLGQNPTQSNSNPNPKRAKSDDDDLFSDSDWSDTGTGDSDSQSAGVEEAVPKPPEPTKRLAIVPENLGQYLKLVTAKLAAMDKLMQARKHIKENGRK